MTARPVGRAAPTLEQVAARAGVSRATAGRVLAGVTTVGAQAREAVLRAAAELSYVTNRAARSLMTRRSDSIAFVVAETEERFFGDPYFSLVLRGAHMAVAEHDVQLVFTILATPEDRERFERFARGGHLDGVIFVSLHGDDPLPRSLQQAGIPVILAGRPFLSPDLPYVSADNVGGARSAVTLLIGRGCRRIATISGPMDMTPSIDRLAGYETELAAGGLRGHGVAEGDFSVCSGRRAMRELLAASPDLDGVFAANDLMAIGAVQVLIEAGRRVPEDVAVIGFDDSPLGASARPSITSVRQPIIEMGEALATRLLAGIERGEPQPPVVMGTEIVLRDTA
ncbi:LacI family DNA-binding transcriptional regulator [Pseudonocardia nigra]|uniref:LacI family DNA-binding transcriptional regulator n=1 Tax=Pseudonocardia nigra TaxID=1921578 RepID=UPI001C5F61AB|nr:LacI family DNA-binding transcriptional regulator [Pseudonocardia nigra]